MVACEICGEGDQFLFQCRHCAARFCSDHQPPGEHLCAAAPQITRIHDQRPRPAITEPDTPTDRPVDAPTQPTGATSSEPAATTTFGSLIPGRHVLFAAVVILVAATAASGFALYGTGLLAGFDPGLEGISGGQPAGEPTPVPAEELNLTVAERSMVERVNAERTSRGVSPVAYDPAIARIARAHSRDMVERDYTAHVSPDGETLDDRFAAVGYDCEAPAELIVFADYSREADRRAGTVSPQNETDLANALVDLWLRSESHRQALLTGRWESAGVGIAVTEDGRVLTTLNAC